MSIRQFINTISIIHRNPYVNFPHALLKHIVWQFKKMANSFPCILKVGKFSVIIQNKIIANGCGGLINSMGFYDPNNMYLIDELSSNGTIKCMFDIGANIGFYSLIPAEKCKVFSFEPHPDTFKFLVENIEFNERNNIIPINKALDNKNGTVEFSDMPGSTINKIIRNTSKDMETTKVETTTGDSYCKEQSIIPDFLKIDTEGNEKAILCGFTNTLPHIKLIAVETDNPLELSKLLAKDKFVGPYKYCHTNRSFLLKNNNHEDWIFINTRFLKDFNAFSFSD